MIRPRLRASHTTAALLFACAAIAPSFAFADDPAPAPAAPFATESVAADNAKPEAREAAEPRGIVSRVLGLASFYSSRLIGRRTASGERYDPEALTAAHRSLPMGTRIRIVNPVNDRSVVVTVNDRGPFSAKRLIDVSAAAAHELGMKASGVMQVETQVLAKGERFDEPGPHLRADASTARDLLLTRD